MNRTLIFSCLLALATSANAVQESSAAFSPCAEDQLIKAIIRPATLARKNPAGSIELYKGRDENGKYCEVTVMTWLRRNGGTLVQIAVNSFYAPALSLDVKTQVKNAYCNGTDKLSITDKVYMPLSAKSAGTLRSFNLTLDHDASLKSVEAAYETFGLQEKQTGSTVCTISK